MSDLSPIGPNNTGPINRASVNGTAPKAAYAIEAKPSDRLADVVELSERAQYLEQLSQMPAVRQDVVHQMKERLSEGNYPSDDQLSVALERMLDDLQE